MTETLIELQNVVVLRHTEATGLFGLWGAKPVRALDGVSLTLRAGETTAVVGGSGGGKTTLGETVTLRREYQRGRLLFKGDDVARLKGDDRRRLQRRLQMIRQDAREGLEMDRTVRKQFQEAMRQYGLPDAESRIAKALDQVELESHFADRTPVEMSGGQQQRVAIARALALNPLLVVADEPVSGVDPRLKADLLRLFAQVQRQQNLGMLLITQDLSVIRRLAHQVAVMHAGRIYEVGPTERMLTAASHPYSRLFLGQEPGRLPGEDDLAEKVYAGCPWVRHCALAIERCSTAAPAMREVAPGHRAACHALE